VSLQRKDGTTAVWWASNQGHLSTIKILLQHGAEANSQDQEKESAIHAGIWSAKSTEVVRALLDAGCDPYLQNINGETALEVCLRKNFGEMARLLAEYMLRDEEAFSKLTSKLTSKASKAWLSGIREQHQTTVAWKTPSPDPRADQKIDEL
jgi:ankyrin repeat protein